MSRKKREEKHIDDGKLFEERLEAELNNWIQINGLRGLCYSFPDGGSKAQRIDLLLDSEDIGTVGIECKSIFELAESFNNKKIELNKLNRIGKDGIGQLERQYDFLLNTGRHGVIAIEFRCSGDIYLIPFIYIFQKICAGDSILTFAEIIQNSFDMNSQGDLVLFLKNKCVIL